MGHHQLPKLFKQARRLHEFLEGDPWDTAQCMAYLSGLTPRERHVLWEDIEFELRMERKRYRAALGLGEVTPLQHVTKAEQKEAADELADLLSDDDLQMNATGPVARGGSLRK